MNRGLALPFSISPLTLPLSCFYPAPTSAQSFVLFLLCSDLCFPKIALVLSQYCRHPWALFRFRNEKFGCCGLIFVRWSLWVDCCGFVAVDRLLWVGHCGSAAVDWLLSVGRCDLVVVDYWWPLVIVMGQSL